MATTSMYSVNQPISRFISPAPAWNASGASTQKASTRRARSRGRRSKTGASTKPTAMTKRPSRSALALSAVRPLRRSSTARFSAVGFTPAVLRIFSASVFGVIASASSSRSAVTKLSPAFFARLSAMSKTLAVSGAR